MVGVKIASYTICHYGRDFLPYSLRSIYDSVDQMHLFFSAHPSHGHATQMPPIETKQDILASLLDPPFLVDGKWTDKLIWHETDFWNEGQQRDYAVRTLTDIGTDLIIIVDYDEIHHKSVLDNMLDYVWQANSARQWLLNFSHHLWRSFNYACTDDGWPVRIIDTRHSEGVAYIPKELGNVYHFGYAVTDATMRYKWQIHGHRDELRPNWFEEKWQAWPPVDDCHPTNGRKENGEGWWNPKPFDKWQLPEVLHSHKWFDVNKIE